MSSLERDEMRGVETSKLTFHPFLLLPFVLADLKCSLHQQQISGRFSQLCTRLTSEESRISTQGFKSLRFVDLFFSFLLPPLPPFTSSSSSLLCSTQPLHLQPHHTNLPSLPLNPQL